MQALAQTATKLEERISHNLIQNDKSYCLVLTNTDPQLHLKLTITYPSLQNAVISGKDGKFTTLMLLPNWGRSDVEIKRVDANHEFIVGPFTYTTEWSNES